jgi:hypothetical protein
MSTVAQMPPVSYAPSVEVPADDEAETFRGLEDALRQIQEKTAVDYGRAVRSVHAKSHAILEGRLEVLPSLPAELAQGLFATPATYDAVRPSLRPPLHPSS